MDATQPGIWLLRTVSRRFRKNVLLHLCSFRIGLVVQDVPRDAFQHLAEFVKRREADCTPFPCFEQGKVGKGNADFFGEFRKEKDDKRNKNSVGFREALSIFQPFVGSVQEDAAQGKRSVISSFWSRSLKPRCARSSTQPLRLTSPNMPR